MAYRVLPTCAICLKECKKETEMEFGIDIESCKNFEKPKKVRASKKAIKL